MTQPGVKLHVLTEATFQGEDERWPEPNAGAPRHVRWAACLALDFPDSRRDLQFCYFLCQEKSKEETGLPQKPEELNKLMMHIEPNTFKIERKVDRDIER